MKILYVTPMWNGLRDIIMDGQLQATGMPAFIKPLQKLREMGHIVDLMVGCDPAYIKPVSNQYVVTLGRIIVLPFLVDGWSKKLRSFFGFFGKVLQQLSKEKYDFVYAQGSLGSIGAVAAALKGIPVGHRLYGTFMFSEIDKHGVLRSTLRHPLEAYAIKSKKNFLLITDDGTRGNEVVSLMSPNRKYDFKFWRNGVDRVVDTIPAFHSNEIFYPGRIARWKRQHLAVELLAALDGQGLKHMRLLFSGHVDDPIYLQEIMDLAEVKGLKNKVEYVGSLTTEEMAKKYERSFAVLMMYDHSNLGNIFLEAFSSGALVCALDSGSLKDYLANGRTGISSSSVEGLAKDMVAAYEQPYAIFEMRQAAKACADEKILDWDSRTLNEIRLIEKCVDQKYA